MNYDRYINQAIAAVPPSGIRRFFDIAATMKDAISLGVGEPDFVTPYHIRNAAINSIIDGGTQYTGNRGLPELCREISEYLSERFHTDYDPKTEIMVTVGASEAIDIALRALVGPGDEVLVPQPSYVSYSPSVIFAGGTPVGVETTADTEFRLTPEALRAAITPRTKCLILPYPNNPTGGIMEKADLEKIAQVVRETGILVISDEIYGELTYGDRTHISFASLPDMWQYTITLNGFSKAYAMTGWRIGYAAGPADIIDRMVKCQENFNACANAPGQYAAAIALEHPELSEQLCTVFAGRRKLLLDGMAGIDGIVCSQPEGAFYVFPCIKSTGMKSSEFCEKLIYSKKVAVVPGSAFGESGEGYVRVSYAYSVQHITTALQRIKEFVEELKK